jgi:hypothetical protein
LGALIIILDLSVALLGSGPLPSLVGMPSRRTEFLGLLLTSAGLLGFRLHRSGGHRQLPRAVEESLLVLVAGVAASQAAAYPSLPPAGVLVAPIAAYLWLVPRWEHSPIRVGADEQPADRHSRQVALIVYAAFCAFALLAARSINGLLDMTPTPDMATTRIPTFLFVNDPLVTVFDKSHLQWAIVQFTALFVIALLLLALLWRYVAVHRSTMPRLEVASALFVSLCVVGSLAVPPYPVDPAHWSVWIGPALDMTRGKWPYLQTLNGYGLLSHLVIVIWLALYPLNTLALASLMMLATFIATSVAYVLIARVTGSCWQGLLYSLVLLFGFVSVAQAIATPNQGPYRWELPIEVGLLCLWFSLSRGNARALGASAVFGIIVLWDPPMMGLIWLAFTGCHVYRFVVQHRRSSLQTLLVANAVTLLVLGVIVLRAGWPADGLPGITRRVTETSAVYLDGWANLPQTFDWQEVLWLIVVGLTLVAVWRRVRNGRIQLRREELFLLGSIAAAMAPFIYNLGRTGPIGIAAVTWTLVPASALLVARGYRFARITGRPAWPVLLLPGTLLLSVNLGGLIEQDLTGLLFGYENDRYAWSGQCAQSLQAGNVCDLSSLPTLHAAISLAQMPVVSGNDPSDRVLIDGCRNGEAILSPIDALIYAAGNCRVSSREMSSVNVVFFSDVERFLQSVMQSDTVLVDLRQTSLPHWAFFASFARQRLIANGYVGGDVLPATQVARFRRPSA